LSGQDNRENNSAHFSCAHVFTQPGSFATEPRRQQFQSSPLCRRKRKQIRRQPCSLRGLQRSALSPSRIARASVSPIERRASLFSRPPHGRRVARRNLPLPQGHQMAPLVRIASHLRTIPAPHVPLKLVDRCCLGSADHIERYGLVRVASEAFHFDIEIPSVQRVTQCRRRLCGRPGRKGASTNIISTRTRQALSAAKARGVGAEPEGSTG
jgi:hypothetical protein